MILRCAFRAVLLVFVSVLGACGQEDGPTSQIDVCGRGDREQLATDLAGGKFALTFRSSDGQVLVVREAAADRLETLPLEMPAGTTRVDVRGLSSSGVEVARGSGAVLGDASCVCLARNQDFDFMCDEVSCAVEDARCTFFDPRSPEPCQLIAQEEIVIDNDSPCLKLGGTLEFLRTESVGFGGSLRWTNTTAEATFDNFARWELNFEVGGLYRIEAFTEADFGLATNALYHVAHGSYLSSVVVDQSASTAWNLIGEFEFDAGGVQFVFLGDNAGPPIGVHVVFDALRVTPVSP